MGFTDVTLQEHVTADHQDTNFEVVGTLKMFLLKLNKPHIFIFKRYNDTFPHLCILGMPLVCCDARW